MARNEEFIDDVEEPASSDGMGTGLVFITSLVLIAAFILVELALKGYGRGLFS